MLYGPCDGLLRYVLLLWVSDGVMFGKLHAIVKVVKFTKQKNYSNNKPNIMKIKIYV